MFNLLSIALALQLSPANDMCQLETLSLIPQGHSLLATSSFLFQGLPSHVMGTRFAYQHSSGKHCEDVLREILDSADSRDKWIQKPLLQLCSAVYVDDRRNLVIVMSESDRLATASIIKSRPAESISKAEEVLSYALLTLILEEQKFPALTEAGSGVYFIVKQNVEKLKAEVRYCGSVPKGFFKLEMFR